VELGLYGGPRGAGGGSVAGFKSCVLVVFFIMLVRLSKAEEWYGGEAAACDGSLEAGTRRGLVRWRAGQW